MLNWHPWRCPGLKVFTRPAIIHQQHDPHRKSPEQQPRGGVVAALGAAGRGGSPHPHLPGQGGQTAFPRRPRSLGVAVRHGCFSEGTCGHCRLRLGTIPTSRALGSLAEGKISTGLVFLWSTAHKNGLPYEFFQRSSAELVLEEGFSFRSCYA